MPLPVSLPQALVESLAKSPVGLSDLTAERKKSFQTHKTKPYTNKNPTNLSPPTLQPPLKPLKPCTLNPKQSREGSVALTDPRGPSTAYLVVRSGVISRVSVIPIRGTVTPFITAHEPPSNLMFPQRRTDKTTSLSPSAYLGL